MGQGLAKTIAVVAISFSILVGSLGSASAGGSVASQRLPFAWTSTSGGAYGALTFGSGTELGALVEYELTFPVDGDHHFRDWFWSARSGGIHHAQDIMAEKMIPVLAVADGTIRQVNWTTGAPDPARCCTLVLKHDDGWESRYIHLNNDSPGTDDGAGWGIADGIAPGVHVSEGTVIGWVGDSGNAESTASHLHFELLDPAGVYVNPFHALAQAGGNWLGSGAGDPLFDGTRLLRIGDRGADVERLQVVLKELGISPGAADGIFGPFTGAAVRGFQIDAGLTADGLVGPATRVALDARYDPVTQQPDRILRLGDRGQDVTRLQELLLESGHDPGPADGIFGSRTDAAVNGFQKAAGLTVDGLVGPMTRAALGF